VKDYSEAQTFKPEDGNLPWPDVLFGEVKQEKNRLLFFPYNFQESGKNDGEKKLSRGRQKK
jgi:hypothetical protein